MEEFIDFEQKININIDLLEIAKDYCEFNNDRGMSTSSLISLIEIMLQNQKTLIADFDKVMIK